jgi:hypothetical protein
MRGIRTIPGWRGHKEVPENASETISYADGDQPMTLQERELLTRFLEQLSTADAGQKDAEAAGFIRNACAKQPEAAYLLVQRTLQLEQLLQASQAQVQKMQADQDRASSGSRGGFLNDPNAWGSRPASPAPTQTPVAQGPGAAAPAGKGSWSTGLFGNIAATAAGVVAGSFLFQGIQGLMNRDDTSSASAPRQPDHAQASEPELLNSYETSSDTGNDSFADSGDSGDFS